MADLAAPGCWTYQYYSPPNNGYFPLLAPFGQPGNYGCGTSFAAPAVGAAAGLLRQHFKAKGGGWAVGANSAGVILTNMLLMGDGYSYDQGGFSGTGFDQRSGAGRMHMHIPDSSNLTSPWGWSWGDATLTSGQYTHFGVANYGPMPAGVTQVKIVMTWFEPDLNNVADIVLNVYDHCNGDLHIAGDMSFDLRKRVTLMQPVIGNKCLKYHVQAFSIPPGQTRTVYTAHYYHSGDPVHH